MTSTIALEMLARAIAGLRASWWLAIPSVSLALLLTLARGMSTQVTRVLRGTLLVAGVVGAMKWAWELRWLCDDAFFSFRYAENLLRGHGLVYNIGERVEGYTNFLWTLLLAGSGSLGFDVPRTSLVLSMLSFAALLLLTDWLPSRAEPERPRLAVPIAALACAAQYSMASFATSGLETMFGSLLALCALERGIAGRWFTSGVAGVCAAMTHPDLGILYAALGAALLLDADTRKHALRYALPFALIYLPYFAWRFHYYGDLFPNTYYAKSANLRYFTQGNVYLMSFLIGGGFWAALPLLGYGAWTQRRSLLGRYCIIATPLFCIYVAKIGGDFMYGRLLCPIVAPLLVLGELAVARLIERSRLVGAALGALGALSIAVVGVPVRIIPPYDVTWQIADERTFYTLQSLDPVRVGSVYFNWAEALLRYFPAHKARPHISMYSAGIIGYFTGWPTTDSFGLTDRMIGHRPIAARGRPGHEKHASPAYLVSREVDISDLPIFPPPFAPLAQITIDGIALNLVQYDPKVLEPLRHKPKVSFTNFESHLAGQLRLPVVASNAEHVACAAWFAEAFYFARVPNSPLRRRVEQRLLAAGRAFSADPPVPILKIDLTAPRHVFKEGSFHFDAAERARLTLAGSAFRHFPADGVPDNQEWVTGFQGTYASTFDPKAGFSARGRLTTAPFALVGDVMELHVGGGLHTEDLRVSLIIDGKRMFSSGGCFADMMGRRLWQIAPFKGKQAVLEIIDRSTEYEGVLMVDEVVQWSAAPAPEAAPTPGN